MTKLLSFGGDLVVFYADFGKKIRPDDGRFS